MITLTPIKPRASRVNFAATERAVRETMQDLAKELKKDLEATTEGWTHKVKFEIEQTSEGYKVGTDDAIWHFGDVGTRKHDIFPSRRKMLRFTTGGAVVFSRHVEHPGTKANNWSKDLGKEYQDEMSHRLNAAIAHELGSD